MESVRFKSAQKALDRLREVVEKDFLSDIERDGLIKRFEFSFEIIWKCGREYLLKVEGLDAASPKKVIRCFHDTGFFTDEETEKFLEMTDDRNLTANTYDEELAIKMVEKIKKNEILLRRWLNLMKNGSL